MDTDPPAEAFRRAVAELQRAAALQGEARPELAFEEEPPPRRLAPFASAVAAVVSGPVDGSATAGGAAARDNPPGAAAVGEADVGGGRFVLLFDPAGQPGWDGRYRVISYVRAELEPEMAADALINQVGWSWLTEALDNREAGYRNISGTVTTVVTQGFGSKQDEPMSTEFELRASWSPVAEPGADPELAGHLAAWCDLMCAAAGLPPLAPGVAALRPPRRRRRP
ncbi:MAG TPA: DUF3000 domain-containing protein [Streptosporangiaceae bacterium]|nr:DUF3000 domain-containing protein [Streptosporangiaceae bacterium]